MNNNVQAFLLFIKESPSLVKEIENIISEHSGKELSKEKLREIIETSILPIAQKYKFEVSSDDILDYLEQKKC